MATATCDAHMSPTCLALMVHGLYQYGSSKDVRHTRLNSMDDGHGEAIHGSHYGLRHQDGPCDCDACDALSTTTQQ